MKVSRLLSLRTVWQWLISSAGKRWQIPCFPWNFLQCCKSRFCSALSACVSFFFSSAFFFQSTPVRSSSLLFVFCCLLLVCLFASFLFIGESNPSPSQIYHGVCLCWTSHLEVDSLSKKCSCKTSIAFIQYVFRATPHPLNIIIKVWFCYF